MKKLLLFILLDILVLSCSPVLKYRNSEEVAKWEKDIEKIEAAQSVNDSGNLILLTGSSSIRLWETAASDLKPYDVIRKAYGGSKLSDYAVYAERIFGGKKYRGAVFFIANDITGAPSDISFTEYMKLFRHVYREFRRSNPNTPFFWVAITPTPSRWQAWPRVKEVNKLVEEFCKSENNAFYINTTAGFLNENNEPRAELFGKDKLHLNDEGYKLWSSYILEALDKVYKNSEKENRN
jgi:hypothetical protein